MLLSELLTIFSSPLHSSPGSKSGCSMRLLMYSFLIQPSPMHIVVCVADALFQCSNAIVCVSDDLFQYSLPVDFDVTPTTWSVAVPHTVCLERQCYKAFVLDALFQHSPMLLEYVLLTIFSSPVQRLFTALQ